MSPSGDDPAVELAEAVRRGMIYWCVARERFGEAAILEAKRRGLIVEQCNGFLRPPKPGEVNARRGKRNAER